MLRSILSFGLVLLLAVCFLDFTATPAHAQRTRVVVITRGGPVYRPSPNYAYHAHYRPAYYGYTYRPSYGYTAYRPYAVYRPYAYPVYRPYVYPVYTPYYHEVPVYVPYPYVVSSGYYDLP
jgi:hypothetical protein